MAFVSNKITSTEFVGPLTGTAQTASLALSSSAATSASYADNAMSASYSVTASYSNNATTASYSVTASYAISASHATQTDNATLFANKDIAQFITTGSVNQEQYITGSLTITQNLYVLGSASLAYVTASQTVVDQNTIVVNASGSGLPTAGLIAADTSSTYSGSSFLYNIMDGIWSLDKPLSASLIGNATTSDTASYVNTLHQNVTVTGSIYVSGSINNIPFWRGQGDSVENLVIGSSALLNNIVTGSDFGRYNTAIGRSTLQENTTGWGNTAVGYATQIFGVEGAENTSLGFQPLFFTTVGDKNTAIGSRALIYLTSGSQNTALGTDAGRWSGPTDANAMNQSFGSVFIGYGARSRSTNLRNEIVIGSGSVGNGNNTTTIGNIGTITTILRGTVSASLFTGSFSGSLFGTASFATQASQSFLSITSSYATTASFVVSSSYALTASYLSPFATASYALTASLSSTASNALTASYLDIYATASYALTSSLTVTASNANTASYLDVFATASYALTASYLVSSSYSVTASNAISSSWALTASYVANASSFPYTGSAEITGSLTIIGGDVTATNFVGTASYALTASYLSGSIESASFASTASFAQTASYFSGSIESASFATTASYLNTSYLVTASLSGSFIEFEKGDGSTFTVSLPEAPVVSGSSGVFAFPSASTQWDINHNFNQQYVTVDIYDSENKVVGPTAISASDANNISVYFTYPVTGYAVVLANGGLARFDYAITGSNTFTANQTISGSLNVTGSIVGRLDGTASYATTASYIESSSYAVTASYLDSSATASAAISASYALSASYVANALEWDGTLSGSSVVMIADYFSVNADNNITFNTDQQVQFIQDGSHPFFVSGSTQVIHETPEVWHTHENITIRNIITGSNVTIADNGTEANYVWQIPSNNGAYVIDYAGMGNDGGGMGTMHVAKYSADAPVSTNINHIRVGINSNDVNFYVTESNSNYFIAANVSGSYAFAFIATLNIKKLY